MEWGERSPQTHGKRDLIEVKSTLREALDDTNTDSTVQGKRHS